jgi:hypothetical protein
MAAIIIGKKDPTIDRHIFYLMNVEVLNYFTLNKDIYQSYYKGTFFVEVDLHEPVVRYEPRKGEFVNKDLFDTHHKLLCDYLHRVTKTINSSFSD